MFISRQDSIPEGFYLPTEELIQTYLDKIRELEPESSWAFYGGKYAKENQAIVIDEDDPLKYILGDFEVGKIVLVSIKSEQNTEDLPREFDTIDCASDIEQLVS